MTIYRPYTYLIGWAEYNLWYYGVRYAKECKPEDLWLTYFTSSKRVKSTRALLGEPNVVEIRKVFNGAKEARAWEYEVIRRMNIVNDGRFLNSANGGKSFYQIGPLSQDTKQKMSLAKIGYNMPNETKLKLSKALFGRKLSAETKNKMIGRKHNEETKNKIRQAANNRKHSEETKQKLREKQTGRKFSEEHKIKLKESWAKRKLAQD